MKLIDSGFYAEDSEEEIGNYLGYSCKVEEENWVNYLESNNCQEEIKEIEKIISENAMKNIGIIKSIQVNSEFRNLGYGSEIMETILDDLSDEYVDIIVLIADTLESNEFSLVNWYKETFGFNVITTDESKLPVMIYMEN